MEATKKLLWGLLLGSAFAVSCPDNTSSCALNCSTTACSGAVNCTANAECSLNCNGNRACSGLKVDGLYQIDPSKYVSTCAGSYDCQNAVLTARAANSTKFLCSGTYGCTGATVNCPSNNCALVCNGGSNSCRGMASFNCLGGETGTCDIQCNGGCYGSLPVTCTNYPCTVTVSGNQTTIYGGFAPPCPAGQKLCTGGICVNSTVTVCPSRCEINDPCKTAQGNECMDVGVAGGPYNCTCDAANFKDGVMSGGLVTTCQLVQTTSNTTNTTNTTNTNTTTTNITKPDTPEVEGNSLILKTYSNDQCTGTPTSTKTFPKGCGNGLPNPGQFSNSRCTNLHYCISTGTGTCGGINFNCIPDQETGVCKNGQMYVCDNSGVAQLTVGFALVIATIAALF